MQVAKNPMVIKKCHRDTEAQRRIICVDIAHREQWRLSAPDDLIKKIIFSVPLCLCGKFFWDLHDPGGKRHQ